jgi:hypothetical protein
LASNKKVSGHVTIVKVKTPWGVYFDSVPTYKKREVTEVIDMSKASKFIILCEVLEALGLDMLKADLAGNLKRVGFSSKEIDNIVKVAPSYVEGEKEWAAFLLRAGLKPMMQAHQKGSEEKLKKLSYFMVRLKHGV